ncbi:AMIN domain-containing protein, partial [Desulfoprunum benzoelyticum]
MKPALSLTACIVGLVSLFLVFPAAFAQDQPSVSSVTLHRDDAGQERIRIKLVGTHAPQVFAYHGDNPRLICDFPGAGYAGLVKPVIRGEGTLVRGIRVGVHNPPDKKVRVVLDLQPGRKYTYDREFNKEENILNIVLLPMAGARKAEDAVAGIDASEPKQIVITGPKKVRHSPAAREEISPAGPPPAAAAAAPAAKPQVPPQA